MSKVRKSMSKKKPTKKKSTFIDGIAASEHLDSSGERIEIRGIDISSLTIDGVLNYEHKSNEASQIVGKITYAKKIYERKDCENDRQRYFWDKIKTPYLYIVGELFDAVGHQGAKDVAAMLRYDEMNKERDDKEVKKLINFSIEGQKLEKRGSLIKKCIARKVSITITPCNKMCEAEELKDTKELEKSDKFSIVQDLMQMKKGEKVSSCQLLKSEFVPKRTFTPESAPNKMKAGDRIDYSNKPKAKTGKDIYGPAPKFNAQGRKITTPSTDAPKATPAHGKLSLVPKPAAPAMTAKPATPKPPKIADAGQKYAQTDRRYATIPDLPKKPMMKNNMRKAIIASTGMGAPSTKVNDLSKEDVQSSMEAVCEPKTDLMKPYASDAQRKWAHTKTGTKALGGKKEVKEWDKKSKGKKLPEKIAKAKVDEKLDPHNRKQARADRKMQSTSPGYTDKDAQNRSAIRAKMGKSTEFQGKNKRPGTFFPGSMEKSKNIVTPAKEMVSEHKKLVNVLRSPSHKDDKKEAKKQAKELKEYKKVLNKSEAAQILEFVQKKYPDMAKTEQLALAKTVALIRKGKNGEKKD